MLVVDDDDGVRASVVRLLGARGFDVTEANDGLVAMGKLGTRAFDVVLTDVHMPHVSGNELLQHVRQERYGCQVVVMTAFADIASAVAAVRAGAFGFLTKPFVSNDALVFEVLNAARLKRLRERNDRLHRELGAAGVGAIIGASPPMQNLFRFIAGFAPSEASVLILGETGTGKELVAKALHDASARAAKPLVIVNCASIPEELIESELFGHVRGAFTSAHQARAGLFEAADGGTLFLDEVGELPLAAQAKLLRALESGEIRRVGSDTVHAVDVRLVAATNADLRTLSRQGEFRQDLYYRLNVATLKLPPLRERGDDVLRLAAHFLAKGAEAQRCPVPRMTDDCVEALCAHTWPGNVRELAHAMQHALILAENGSVSAASLPADVRATRSPDIRRTSSVLDADLAQMPYADAKRVANDRFVAAYVQRALDLAGGNVNEAARRSGIDRSNFRKLLRRGNDGSSDE